MRQQNKNGEKFMEQNSRCEILEEQIRECYGRVVWTHKAHEKCADILNSRNDWLKVGQIFLSVVTTSGLLLTVFGDNRWAAILAAFVSSFSLGLSIYVKKHDLGSIAQKHADAAISIWSIRERYFSLLTDIRAGLLETTKIREMRDQLQGDLHKIYRGSPRTISKAYQEASKALKIMEEMTLSPEEIDKFLPNSLKKTVISAY